MDFRFNPLMFLPFFTRTFVRFHFVVLSSGARGPEGSRGECVLLLFQPLFYPYTFVHLTLQRLKHLSCRKLDFLPYVYVYNHVMNYTNN